MKKLNIEKIRGAVKTKSPKVGVGGGGFQRQKIKNSTIQNVDYFETRVGGVRFSGFSQIQMAEIWPWF